LERKVSIFNAFFLHAQALINSNIKEKAEKFNYPLFATDLQLKSSEIPTQLSSNIGRKK